MNSVFKITILVLLILFLSSCTKNLSYKEFNPKYFLETEKAIKNKFGNNAYFINLSIENDKSLGKLVRLVVTDKPESLKMEEWALIKGSWRQIAKVSIEIPNDTQAKDFMFMLNHKISLEKLGVVLEQTKLKILTEKGVGKSSLLKAFIYFPKSGDISKASYNILLNTKNKDTVYRFVYQLNGELLKTNL